MCETGRTANPALSAFVAFARAHLQDCPNNLLICCL
jgi:hypothetical protein